MLLQSISIVYVRIDAQLDTDDFNSANSRLSGPVYKNEQNPDGNPIDLKKVWASTHTARKHFTRRTRHTVKGTNSLIA
jgi:hypothetical protein